MSIEEKITRTVPVSITASNAEFSAKEIVNKWLLLSNDGEWNLEACKTVSNVAIDYSSKWKNAVMPSIEEEIVKYRAEYEETKAKYDAAEQMWNAAYKSERAAKKDMDACMDYDGNMYEANSKKVVTDRIGYAAAKNRHALAEAELNRCKSEMNTWKKQMGAAKDKMNAAEHKKKELEEKIEHFILEVYSIKQMDECADFLHSIKNSNITLSKNAQKTLFGRLFLLEHKYRKCFDKFQQIIAKSSEKYAHTKFDVAPDSLSYSANRNIALEKIEADFTICCESKDTNSAELRYTGKKEFHISKANAEAAQKDISSKCKAFTLSTERSNFVITLDKKYENNEIESELENLNENSDSYTEECKALLEAFKKNGASSSKFHIFLDKITNWHLNHWVKLWYKIVFVLALIILVLGIGIGGYAGILTAVTKHKYNKSFISWIVTDKTTGSGYRRYNFDDGTIRTFNVSVIPENKVDSKIKAFIEYRNEDDFIEMTEEEIEWYKTLISESGFVKPSTNCIVELEGNYWNRGAEGSGYFKVSADSEGKITELTSASELGDFYYPKYIRERYFENND